MISYALLPAGVVTWTLSPMPLPIRARASGEVIADDHPTIRARTASAGSGVRGTEFSWRNLN